MLKQFRIKSTVIASLVLAVLCCGQDMWLAEADRLAPLLNWPKGDVVAEIGAGAGEFTVLASERVGPTGKSIVQNWTRSP